MKTAGIIGGLGPETTSQFYLEVVFSCFRINKIARPPLLIWSVPIEYQVESDLITKTTGEERYLPYLLDAARRLEGGGADFIVIPCNSVHIFIDDVRKAVKIPVLSIVEETAKFLKENSIKNIGLLATKTTIEKRIYQKVLFNNNISVTLPDEEEQSSIGTLINNLVLNRYDNEDRQELLKIIEKFNHKGLKKIVLACTDLQLLTPKLNGLMIYDSMEILAKATVREILK